MRTVRHWTLAALTTLIVAPPVFAHDWGGRRPGVVLEDEDTRTQARRAAIDARKRARGISVHNAAREKTVHGFHGPKRFPHRDFGRHPSFRHGQPDFFFRFRGRHFEVGYGRGGRGCR